MDGAWINLEKKEIQAGMTYVALSRLRTLDKCVIEAHQLDRLQKCRTRDMSIRITEEKRLEELEKKFLCSLPDYFSIEDDEITSTVLSENDFLEEEDEVMSTDLSENEDVTKN